MVLKPGLIRPLKERKKESENRSVVSNSLRPHGLYTVHGILQATGVGSLSLLQGDLPNPGTKPRFPALQADSLPAESHRKPHETTSNRKQGPFPRWLSFLSVSFPSLFLSLALWLTMSCSVSAQYPFLWGNHNGLHGGPVCQSLFLEL